MIKSNQRDRVLRVLLNGKEFDRKKSINMGLAWELSARICGIQDKYGIEILRGWVEYGQLRCRTYRIERRDIPRIKKLLGIDGKQ